MQRIPTSEPPRWAAWSGAALEQAMTAMDRSRSTGELVACMARLAAAFGYEGVGHAQFGEGDGLVVCGSGRFLVTMHDWLAHYRDHDYLAIDPVVQAARGGLLPVDWRADRPLPGDDARQRRIYREARDFGIWGGLCIPSHGLDGVAYTGLFHGQPAPEHAALALAQLNYAAQYMQESRRRLAGGPADVARLSGRELACLAGMKDGLPVPRIADRLHISERTVNFHLRNCRDKLGARSTTQAVARAIALRLLD